MKELYKKKCLTCNKPLHIFIPDEINKMSILRKMKRCPKHALAVKKTQNRSSYLRYKKAIRKQAQL